MRENGCDSTLPRSTRFSLILQSQSHATTTNIMRNVEYITNGFGGPIPIPPAPSIPSYLPSYPSDSYAGPSGRQWFNYAPIETKIRAYLESVPVPQNIVEAAIRTYNKFGPSGLQKTVQFVDAIEDAEGALERMFPNIRNQLRGPMAGLAYKRAFNGILNTAASRIGLTPLSSELRQTIRERLNRIPDSSIDPKSQFNQLIPSYIQSMRIWVGYLTSGVS